MRIVVVIVLWECEPYRCVRVHFAEPDGMAVQVWKGDATITSVSCDDHENAAIEAARLYAEYCEPGDSRERSASYPSGGGQNRSTIEQDDGSGPGDGPDLRGAPGDGTDG